MRICFNEGWQFLRCPVDKTELSDLVGYEQDWVAVDIPHDFLIGDANRLYEEVCGWYRKREVFAESERGLRERSYRLYFEGVYMDCTVFVNGQEAGCWKYGYSSFEVDITPFVVPGENEILVRVWHRSPNSRWYSGAGIYRNIDLVRTRRTYLLTEGVYFSAEKQGNQWLCTLDAEVHVDAADASNLSAWCVTASLTSQDACDALEGRIGTWETKLVQQGETTLFRGTFTVEAPLLWSVGDAHCYTLTTELLYEGRPMDALYHTVGFRTFDWQPDTGLAVNGVPVKLRGACLHHDLGALGAAVSRDAIARQLHYMQEMGVNAVRTSHNMPAPELLELCDRMGILVIDEAFDMWEREKTPYDYARFFPEWYERDVKSWITRDRNHPSVLMWSIGNEIYDTHVSGRGYEVTEQLVRVVKQHDPRGNAFTTHGSNYIFWDGAQKCSQLVEVQGYNYAESVYEEHHKTYPHWRIYGSETAARVQSRGVYHFPYEQAYITHADLQCSSLGNCRRGERDRRVMDALLWDEQTPFCAGQFIWTGIDYIGEPSPYFTKNAYFGQMDTACFPKDSFYLYQSVWSNKPVLHMMPYWDFNEGQLIDVVVYSNLCEAELFFGEESLGRKDISEWSARWQLPYAKGVLKVVGYNAAGEAVLEDTRCSFGDTADFALQISTARSLLGAEESLSRVAPADGKSLFFLEISAVDENGTPVANARDRVRVRVTGAGRLLGLDNGDSTDYDSYKSDNRRLFSGKLLAIIGTEDAPGEITVEVIPADASLPIRTCQLMTYSPGDLEAEADKYLLTPRGRVPKFATLALTETGLPDRYTTTYHPQASKIVSSDMTEISVRKIELTAAGNHLSPELPEVEVQAVCFPANATDQTLVWSVVTPSGVETNLAEITVLSETETDGTRVQRICLKALGDGAFRLRCSSHNQKPQPEVISELEFTVSDMGLAGFDPYHYVRGSLADATLKKPDEVAEGGVMVYADNPYFGYRQVDFGPNGSDTVEIFLIQWHDNSPVTLRIWKGLPWQGEAVCLGSFVHQRDFIWQTYQSCAFTLPEVLRGKQDICFEILRNNHDLNFGGFVFAKNNRAYARNLAKDNDVITGDRFEEQDGVLRGIGNNVFIHFYQLDFCEGATSLVICGQTRHDNDSIHVHVTDVETGEVQQEIVEFPGTPEETQVRITFPKVQGRKDVIFGFLPGCDFDFHWFQFEKETL